MRNRGNMAIEALLMGDVDREQVQRQISRGETRLSIVITAFFRRPGHYRQDQISHVDRSRDGAGGAGVRPPPVGRAASCKRSAVTVGGGSLERSADGDGRDAAGATQWPEERQGRPTRQGRDCGALRRNVQYTSAGWPD